MGGKIYDNNLGKGVRKKYQPEPNPTKVELKRETKYTELLNLAKRMYFSEFEESSDALCLADSAGVPISVSNETTWTLGTFYSGYALQPSRYNLYVLLKVYIYTIYYYVVLYCRVFCSV